MSNPLSTVGHDIKVGVVDAAKGIKDAVTLTAKLAEVIGQPGIEPDIIALVALAETVLIDLGGDVAADGLNIAQDAKTLADVGALLMYLKGTFIPAVEAAYKKTIVVVPTPVKSSATSSPTTL